MRSSFRQLQRLCFYLILAIIATACGGGGGGGDGGGGDGTGSGSGSGIGGNSGGSTTPISVGMNHEVTYDAATTPASIVGSRVNNLFGANHHNLQMVFNASGVGMAVWITTTTGTVVETEKLVYATYDPVADSWSAEKTIFVLTNESNTPKTLFKLAASDNDFALAWKVSQVYRVTDENVQVWESFNYAKVFSNGAWTEAMRLNAFASNSYLQAPVVSSNGSSFLFAWQEDGSMVSREWNNGTMSGPASALSGGTTGFNDIELVSNGSIYMLKVEHGSSFSVRHMTVVAYQSGNWSTPITTEDNQGSINYSKITSAGNNFLMTWVQDSTPYHRYYSAGNWSAMTTITDGPTGNHQLSSNGTDYSLSWIASNRLNVKLFSGGNWSNSETPESIPGNVTEVAATGTSYGFNYSLRVRDSSTFDFDLYLLSYKGGVSGDSVLVESDSFDVFDHAIAFGNSKTFISWQQFDGANMQFHTAAYNDNVVSSAATALSQVSHGGGVTTGKIATTVGGVRVAAWGQSYFDATGTEIRAAFARVDDNTGSYGATVHLRDYSEIRDVVVVGETVIVLLDVVNGLSAIEYRNGSWTSVTSFNGGFTYDWEAYVLNNQLFLFWTTNTDSNVAVYESGTWGASTTINTSALNAGYYDLASNGEDVMVTWQEWSNDPLVTPADFIKTRFYDSSTGLWSAEQTLDSYDAIVGGRQPKVDANASGFMVSWSRADTNTNPSTMSLYTSICDATGVCGAADTMLAAINAGSYIIYTAANDSGFMFVYSLDGFFKYHVYNGTSWSAVSDLGLARYVTIKLAGHGNDFIMFESKDSDTTNFEDDTVVDYYRYSSGSWSTPERIIGLDAAIELNNFKVFDIPGALTLTWRSPKPGAHYNIYNLYTTSWDGSQWSGVEQINTGKFGVRNYHVDTTNNQLRFSLLQAQEGDTDPSAPALWELIK